jgi:hypothetical protein
LFCYHHKLGQTFFIFSTLQLFLPCFLPSFISHIYLASSTSPLVASGLRTIQFLFKVVDIILLNVAHLLTKHVRLSYSGSLLPPQSKWQSGFTTVLCCTWQSETAGTPDGASKKSTKSILKSNLVGCSRQKPTCCHYNF